MADTAAFAEPAPSSSSPARRTVAAAIPVAGGEGASGCTRGSVLCLTQNRFRVTVEWQDFQGNRGLGTARQITGDTGTFWFFDEANVELVVKILDARIPPNPEVPWTLAADRLEQGFDGAHSYRLSLDLPGAGEPWTCTELVDSGAAPVCTERAAPSDADPEGLHIDAVVPSVGRYVSAERPVFPDAASFFRLGVDEGRTNLCLEECPCPEGVSGQRIVPGFGPGVVDLPTTTEILSHDCETEPDIATSYEQTRSPYDPLIFRGGFVNVCGGRVIDSGAASGTFLSRWLTGEFAGEVSAINHWGYTLSESGRLTGTVELGCTIQFEQEGNCGRWESSMNLLTGRESHSYSEDYVIEGSYFGKCTYRARTRASLSFEYDRSSNFARQVEEYQGCSAP